MCIRDSPGTIAGSYRTGYSALAACGALGLGGLNGVCDAGLVSKGERLNATGAKVHLAKYTNPAFAASAALGAYDLIARIDGTYTEFFHNATPKFELDAQAIFTEFYFDVADNHKLTVGLRYNEDRKEIGACLLYTSDAADE